MSPSPKFESFHLQNWQASMPNKNVKFEPILWVNREGAQRCMLFSFYIEKWWKLPKSLPFPECIQGGFKIFKISFITRMIHCDKIMLLQVFGSLYFAYYPGDDNNKTRQQTIRWLYTFASTLIIHRAAHVAPLIYGSVYNVELLGHSCLLQTNRLSLWKHVLLRRVVCANRPASGSSPSGIIDCRGAFFSFPLHPFRKTRWDKCKFWQSH